MMVRFVIYGEKLKISKLVCKAGFSHYSHRCKAFEDPKFSRSDLEGERGALTTFSESVTTRY
jgi:hypothetical protein